MNALKLFSCLLLLVSAGCARAKMGKVDLSQEPPAFLEVGQTPFRTVIERLGEPLGYREANGRIAVSYLDFRDEYTFFLLGEIRIEEAKLLVLSFEDQILSDVQVRPEGWGFGLNVDPNTLNLLTR